MLYVQMDMVGGEKTGKPENKKEERLVWKCSLKGVAEAFMKISSKELLYFLRKQHSNPLQVKSGAFVQQSQDRH